jgi:hypothetical protein
VDGRIADRHELRRLALRGLAKPGSSPIVVSPRMEWASRAAMHPVASESNWAREPALVLALRSLLLLNASACSPTLLRR